MNYGFLRNVRSLSTGPALSSCLVWWWWGDGDGNSRFVLSVPPLSVLKGSFPK